MERNFRESFGSDAADEAPDVPLHAPAVARHPALPAASPDAASQAELGAKRGHRQVAFAPRLRDLARIEVDESEAKSLWTEVSRHARSLRGRLGREVGLRVALLDHLLNVAPGRFGVSLIGDGALHALERDAITDGLTGLYNRTFFENAFHREVQRSRRYGDPCSLLLLDVDQFKQVNDRLGHRAGDVILQAIGALVRAHLRSVDIAARYGGDEFAVILPETGRHAATVVAERIRDAVARRINGSSTFGAEPVVTVSGGLATMPADGSSVESLFGRADAALYDAKSNGENLIASPPSLDRDRHHGVA